VTTLLAWLTARPLAHRGLHDASAGVIENTASAFHAAAAGSYGIECDVQLSRDGEAMVQHDNTLSRLMESRRRVEELTTAELQALPYRACGDRMLTLSELCDLVRGRVALAVEIKSRFDGDLRLTQRVTQVLSAYRGSAAAMSFDPSVVAALRQLAPALPRGIVAEWRYGDEEWKQVSRIEKLKLGLLLHAPRTRPHFVAYQVRDLPSPAPFLARSIFGVPLLTWTVRTPEDRRTAARWADQMIFEGFRPEA
jgi:glycerophosphoryl diester phosphodiesterase